MKQLRMAVCMKQVPAKVGDSLFSDGKICRDAYAQMINPSDMYPLETALMLKEKFEGQVDIFTMGTKSAQMLLKETALLGADALFLLSDDDFAGADTYATAFVLAKALEKTGKYDLIFCGRRSLDGETGQIPIQIAEMLNIPVVTNVIWLSLLEKTFLCRRLLEEREELVEGTLPAVIGVMEGMEGIEHPRLPSVFQMSHGARKEIVIFDRKALGLEKDAVGRAGSFTEVEHSVQFDWKRRCQFYSLDAGMNKIMDLIEQTHGNRERSDAK